MLMENLFPSIDDEETWAEVQIFIENAKDAVNIIIDIERL